MKSETGTILAGLFPHLFGILRVAAFGTIQRSCGFKRSLKRLSVDVLHALIKIATGAHFFDRSLGATECTLPNSLRFTATATFIVILFGAFLLTISDKLLVGVHVFL